jgi:hypothetical protein
MRHIVEGLVRDLLARDHSAPRLDAKQDAAAAMVERAQRVLAASVR